MGFVEVYTRCMDGEYFSGYLCPNDGHQGDWSVWVTDAVEKIRRDGVRPSLDELIRRGLPLDAADGVLVVEFNSEAQKLDMLRPFPD